MTVRSSHSTAKTARSSDRAYRREEEASRLFLDRAALKPYSQFLHMCLTEAIDAGGRKWRSGGDSGATSDVAGLSFESAGRELHQKPETDGSAISDRHQAAPPGVPITERSLTKQSDRSRTSSRSSRRVSRNYFVILVLSFSSALPWLSALNAKTSLLSIKILYGAPYRSLPSSSSNSCSLT